MPCRKRTSLFSRERLMPEQHRSPDSLAPSDDIGNGARERVQAVHQTLYQEGFERYQKRRADNTLRRQRADMALFEASLADVGIALDHLFTDPSQWRCITFALVEHFLEWQLEKGYAIASINSRLATIKKYAAVACQLGILSSDELFRIREVKGFRRVEGRRIDLKRSVTRIGEKKAEPTFLTEEQLAALFRVPDVRTARGWRDLLLLRLLYDLGLRPGEIVSMQVADLDMAQAILHVRRHKTDGEQFLRLTPSIIAAASHYFQWRRDRDSAAPLIVKASYAGGLVELMKRKDGQVVTVPLGLRGVCARVHLLGLAIGVNLNAYDQGVRQILGCPCRLGRPLLLS